MTRGILGRFFDWTFGSLCADAELKKAEEARARAKQEGFLPRRYEMTNKELRKEKTKEELRKKKQKIAAVVDYRKKLEAEKDKALEMAAKKRTKLNKDYTLLFSTRVDQVKNKIRELTEQNSPSEEIQRWKDLHTSTVEEINQNYTKKLETIDRETKEKILEFDQKIADLSK
jgi:hypothetical protein